MKIIMVKNILIILVSILFISCTKEKQKKLSGDYSYGTELYGTYKGTIPCADCNGIIVTLTLNKDHSFSKRMEYLPLNKENNFFEKGAFIVEDGKVVLSSKHDSRMYKIRKGCLEHLDNEGNRIKSSLNYMLNKDNS